MLDDLKTQLFQKTYVEMFDPTENVQFVHVVPSLIYDFHDLHTSHEFQVLNPMLYLYWIPILELAEV